MAGQCNKPHLCGYCWFQGTFVGRFPYPIGYSKPAPQAMMFTEEELGLHANDKRVQISAECATTRRPVPIPCPSCSGTTSVPCAYTSSAVC